jgi:hypothetical protein
MRKSSKLILVAGAIAALAVPSAAMAEAPTGSFAPNNDAVASTMTVDQWVDGGYGSAVGYYSSRTTQNGEFIGGASGNKHVDDSAYAWAPNGIDNTTAPQSRSEIVQTLHATEGKGSLK